jgi:hypothetical protein
VKKWGGILALVLVIVALIAFHDRISPDFWPLDASRVGPNLVASVVQWALIALVAYLVYPPIRRKIDAELEKAHRKLDHNAALLRHVIKHHPDIPNEDHNGDSLIEEKQ